MGDDRDPKAARGKLSQRPADDEEPTRPDVRLALNDDDDSRPTAVRFGGKHGSPALDADADIAHLRALLDGITLAPSSRLSSRGAIAHGGMGSIEAVTDAVIRRDLAMKVIHERLQSSPKIVEMFIREAQITGQLDHPNIVPVHELGLDPAGRLYFTMKLVEGTTLADLLRELPAGEIEYPNLLNLLDIVVKVCDALALAHSRGVVHCDIKPENIMVGEFGEVYLMDWGLARSHDNLVDEGTFVGTPAYMSPEQASGENLTIDARSDVFGVGAILYEVITRTPPFERETFWASVVAANDCDYTPLSECPQAQTVPRGLLQITNRALSAQKADRYADARALKDQLVRFMRGGGQFPSSQVDAGTIIVRQGEPGDSAYIIVTGRCEVYKEDDGERIVLREMGAGDVFGETAILSPGPRTASVVALEAMTLRVVTGEVLEAEVDSMKPWVGAFIRALATRFRERENQPARANTESDD